jgi:hypothetical protein
VHIERCTIHGFPVRGVLLNQADLTVTDSVVRDNAFDGMGVWAGHLTVDNARFENNGQEGLYFLGGTASISRSLLSGNGGAGISAADSTISVTATTSDHNLVGYEVLRGQMTLDSVTARGNVNEGLAVTASTARLSNSVLTNNGIGVVNVISTVLTRQNNTVSGNAEADLAGDPLTPLGGV